jgi:hypothetical protein
VTAATKSNLEDFTPFMDLCLGMVKEGIAADATVMDRICTAMLDDLDRFCGFVKEYGFGRVEEHFQTVTVSTWPSEFGHLAGTYVGVGLGNNWLNLGFLEGVVAKALKIRLEEMADKHKFGEPMSVAIASDAARQRGVYLTRRGAYYMSSTYCWFIKKRVE